MKKIKITLAPTWVKIITSFIIFVFVPVFPVKFILMDADPQVYYLSLLKILTAGIRYKPFELWPQVIVFVPVFALAAIYLFVAILAGKVHWGDKIRLFVKFAKPGKAKIIIFVIGITTLPGFILMYIVGCYGGLMGLPEDLRRIYSLYDNFYFELVAIPVTFISFLFYKINSFIIAVVSLITFGTGLYIFDPVYLADYSIVVTVVLYTMMVVEWYLFACAMVKAYRKIKGRRHGKNEYRELS